MIKVHFSREKLSSICFSFGVEFAKVPVTNPKTHVRVYQPTLTFGLTLLHTAFYIMIYRPAKLGLTRNQRRHYNIS